MIKHLLMTALGLAVANVGFASGVGLAYHTNEDTKEARICFTTNSDQDQKATIIEIPDEIEILGVTYKVTEIEPNALNNFPNVTEVIIGKNIATIGAIKVTDSAVRMGDAQNFYGCPKLEKYTVRGGSTTFAATGAGILVVKGMNAIAKVPQALPVTDGVLKMSASTTGLCAGAFAENSTITDLYLAPSLAFGDYSNSFNDMLKLRRFYVNGSATPANFSVKAYVLYNADQTKVISFPPAYQVEGFSCASSVTEVGYKAFANTQLYQVTMYGVKKIGQRAFYKSRIVSAELPSTVTTIGDEAYMDCPRLGTITLNSTAALPAGFARSSSALTTVKGNKIPSAVGAAAFKDCVKLTSYPFNGATNCNSDSAFVNCGFTEVKFTGTYKPNEDGGYRFGRAFFEGNLNLTKIDLSGLKADAANPTAPVDIYWAFSVGCPELKKIWFSEATNFVWLPLFDGDPGMFGPNPIINEFVLGGFQVEGATYPAIRYDSGVHLPVVYLRTTGTPYHYCYLSRLFFVSGTATCQPTFYCDAYTLKGFDEAYGNYIVPGAKYYIPGGTAENYADVKEQAQFVQEMYTYTPSKTSNGKYKLTLKSNLSYLVFTKVIINGTTYAPYPDNGLTVDVDFDKVGDVDVYYNVDGVEMHTIYPGSNASIESVGADEGGLQAAVNGTEVSFGETAAYEVIDLSGRIVGMGEGYSVNLDELAHGTYIVIAKGMNGGKATVKVVR